MVGVLQTRWEPYRSDEPPPNFLLIKQNTKAVSFTSLVLSWRDRRIQSCKLMSVSVVPILGLPVGPLTFNIPWRET